MIPYTSTTTTAVPIAQPKVQQLIDVTLQTSDEGVRLSAWLPDGPPAIKVLSPSDCRDLAVRLICAAGEVRR